MQRMYLSLQPEKTVFMKKTNTQNQKKTNPYYGLLWGFLLVLFLNGLIFPKFGRGRIIETDYGTFVGKVDSGKVKDVMIKSSHIYFTAKETDGKTITYQTGEINDPKLVDRLLSDKSPNKSGKISFNEIHVGSPRHHILSHMATGRQKHQKQDGRRRQLHVVRQRRGQDICRC